MIYTISKEFHFSASHILTGLPAGHQCTRLHGHNYTVIVELSGRAINRAGFLVDYADITNIVQPIIDTFEHRHLNDVVKFNPTAENLARYLFNVIKPQLPALSAIIVKETAKTSARYGIK